MNFRIRHAATLIAALVVLAGGAAALWPRTKATPSFLPEQVAMLKLEDNSAARAAHRTALGALALFTVAGMLAARHLRRAPPGLAAAAAGLERLAAPLAFLAMAAVIALDVEGLVYPDPQGRAVRLGALLGGGLLAGLAVRARAASAPGPRARLAGFAAAFAYAAALAAPGLFREVALPEPLLSFVEGHYSATLAQADRLAAGLALFSQARPTYGLVPALALGAFERAFGLLDLAAHVRVVQLSQLAFFCAAAAALWRWSRVPAFLAGAALLVGPWLSTSHLAVYFPNQSGWRALGLALGVLVLVWLGPKAGAAARRGPFLLGAVGALLVANNPETGLCVAFGFALFLATRPEHRGARALGIAAGQSVAGAALGLFALGLATRAATGAWPTAPGASLWGFVLGFSQGFGSLEHRLQPLAALIALHCTWLVAALLMRARARPLPWRDSVRLALAGAALAWGAYYANRPHPWNLWTFQFLEAFLLAGWLAPRRLSRWRHLGLRALGDPRLAALAFIVLPCALLSNLSIARLTLEPPRPPPGGELLSGAWVRQEISLGVVAQVDALSAFPADTLFFTRHAYSMSLLTGRFNPLRCQDALAETLTLQDFEALVAEVFARAPRTVLFDAAAPALGSPTARFYRPYLERLAQRLSPRYARARTAGGWDVWEARAE